MRKSLVPFISDALSTLSKFSIRSVLISMTFIRYLSFEVKLYPYRLSPAPAKENGQNHFHTDDPV